MAGLMTGHTGRLYPFLQRYLVVREELEQARSLELSPTWGLHANDAYEAESELIAALGAWDDVPQRVNEMRAHASVAGTAALVAFADRLEGRAALAAGNTTAAIELLERAATNFSGLGARSYRARPGDRARGRREPG